MFGWRIWYIWGKLWWCHQFHQRAKWWALGWRCWLAWGFYLAVFLLFIASFWPNNMCAPSCCVVMLVMFLFLLFEVAPLGFFGWGFSLNNVCAQRNKEHDCTKEDNSHLSSLLFVTLNHYSSSPFRVTTYFLFISNSSLSSKEPQVQLS